jgi:gliding-associated putative ABC transporter substrate-binding component GldG
MNRLINHKYWWLPVLAVSLALLYAGALLPWRLDLTAEKRYSISRQAQQLLAGIKQPVEVIVLLKDEGMPAGFRKLANSTEAFLVNCRRYSKGKLVYRFVNAQQFADDSIQFPLGNEAKAGWLKENAVKQNEVSGSGSRATFLYPLALVRQGDNYEPVNLLQGQGNKGFLNPDAALLQYEAINKAEAQLEYLFALAIKSLQSPNAPIVAYATGNGEPTGPETYDLSATLSSRYRFYLLQLQQQPFISDSIKALVIVKPSVPFSDEDKLKIDQYIMRGGRVLFLADALNADMDSLLATGRDFTAYSRNLNIDDLLFRYGARVNNDLVQEKQCDMLPQAVGSVGGQPQIELLPWPYFPLLYSTSNHPIAKNLDAVVMQFPNSVDTVKAEGINKEVLLATSNTSRIQGAPVIVTVEILKQQDAAAAFRQQNIPLAVLLEGKFRSLYANRMNPEALDSLQKMGVPYQAAGQKEGKVLVAGDGDFVLNGTGRKGPLPMGMNPYTEYQFANRDFLLNAIDYMTDESGIMALRSRDYALRLLDPKKLEAYHAQLQWLNIGLPLVLLVLAGAFFSWLRKRRFTA